ncbi:MAG: copper chaperone [Marinoscillum sp.]
MSNRVSLEQCIMLDIIYQYPFDHLNHNDKMEINRINIANLSCNGCVNTITKKLSAIDGVENVTVSLETSVVTVNHAGNVDRSLLTEKLRSLGYPEATEKNGLLTHIKSVGSCMAGRITK